MKTVIAISAACVVALGLVGCGGSDSGASAGSGQAFSMGDAESKCEAAAAKDVQIETGHPASVVKTITPQLKYVVSSYDDSANSEDFFVLFTDGCTTFPKIDQVPKLPPALQPAAHTAYDTLLLANANVFPAANVPAPSSLPPDVKSLYDALAGAAGAGGATAAIYEVDVSGQPTYAVGLRVSVGTIGFLTLTVYDANASEIDEVSIDTPPSGDNSGITWKNVEYEIAY